MRPRLLLAALALALLGALLPGGATAQVARGGDGPRPLPAVDRWDYQIGGVRGVPDDVHVVVRDREAPPVERGDVYDVCYVNAFQTQPNEKRFWRQRWGLVLKKHGRAVVDSGWGEWLLDIRTAEKRRRLAAIVGRWMTGCAEAGYDAVEPDNLDSFLRSKDLIEPRQTNAFVRLLADRAHEAGLAIAQKNRAGWDGTRFGLDFAVAEECAEYDECGAYRRYYGPRVLAVEYGAEAFTRACRQWEGRIALVRRDYAVSPKGVRRWC
ncbi:endo alpha-1,4 polygalactosaminidase [Nocardioides sp. CFH 31398]|uniref:endo alpha-1,4 polygalactosaminidase n=1 Tax=Nocardioides sp. CFH 31398 TaxID=2919579 RepID=UPI001F054638|nr:endo alpha-1,4 polygalactosaminidase [Nocardioides sp. CFH 31398]MCH1868845.1 endo alpha-1,4 polygalactosaminidase [Nocardioides sp. CFH 31398]